MHIVYVSREYPPSLRGGGIASYLKIVAEGFAARGHEVTVIAANDDTRLRNEQVINGVRIIRLEGGDFLIDKAEPNQSKLKKLRFAYRFWSYRKKIVEEIRKLNNVNIIEVAEFGAEGLYLNKLDIPVVYRLHTPAMLDRNNFGMVKLNKHNFPIFPFGKIELNILRRFGKHITSCSSSLKEWVIKYIGLPSESIRTIFNPLQPDFFNSNLEVTRTNGSPYIFFAGTICDSKGTEDLFEAMKMLNNGRKSKVRLLMAGKTGTFTDTLREQGKEFDWFEILGKLPQQELKSLYKNASVVCFPSWWENMPMVCLEAMSLGSIVIGSNSGGMAEIIEDSKSGFLLPPKNPKLWAEKIETVLSLTSEEREKISGEATKRIKEVFSLDKILDETESYFNEIIS